MPRRKNQSRYVLLGLLDMRPMSGYDIKKILEFSFSDIWSESYGNIYPTLKAFLKDGLAEEKRVHQEGKPDRIVYSITPKGKKELTAWLKKPYEKRRVRDEFLMKLLFGYSLSREDNARLMESYLTLLRERVIWYRESTEALEKQGITDQKDLLEYLALLQGKMVQEAKIRWCEKSISMLREFGQ
ncbi:PadR family transcriptional regulator [bacterium]|nr:PadR family transcriptional regulator [bacterium]